MIDINEKKSFASEKRMKELYILFAYIIGLSIISFLYINNQISIVNVATIGLTLVALVAIGVDYGVPIVIAAYSFTLWIPYIYVSLTVLVYFLIKHLGKTRIFKPVLWYLLIAILASVSLTTQGASLDYYLRITISELAIVILFTTDSDNNVAIFSIISYCLAFFLKIFVTFFTIQKYSNIDYIIQNRLGYATMMSFLPDGIMINNENALALFAILTIVLLYVLRSIDGGVHINRILFILGVSLAIIIGLMTKSRTFFLTGGLFALFILFSKKGSIGNRIIFLFLYAVLAIGAFFAIIYFMPTIYDGIVSRFTMYDDLTNGRTDIFATINNYFFSGDLKGILFGYLAEKDYGLALGFEDAFHNVIQRTYVLYGLVGAAAFIGLFFSSFQFNIRIKKRPLDLLFLVPFTITFVAGLGSNPDLIIFLFCIYLIRLNDHALLVNVQDVKESSHDAEIECQVYVQSNGIQA